MSLSLSVSLSLFPSLPLSLSLSVSLEQTAPQRHQHAATARQPGVWGLFSFLKWFLTPPLPTLPEVVHFRVGELRPLPRAVLRQSHRCMGPAPITFDALKAKMSCYHPRTHGFTIMTGLQHGCSSTPYTQALLSRAPDVHKLQIDTLSKRATAFSNFP